MPIIHMGDSFEYRDGQKLPRQSYHDGEYCPLPSPGGMNGERQGWTLYETHHGLCISEREANGYDDSDFYMLVWDPVARRPFETMFATTRGWSYPCMGSRPDATPEVLAAYDAWRKREARKAAVMHRRHQRQADAKLAREAGLAGREAVERLREAVGGAYMPALAKLLTAKLRSPFRQSLAAQVRAWLEDPSPRYPSPLSPRQLGYV